MVDDDDDDSGGVGIILLFVISHFCKMLLVFLEFRNFYEKYTL